MKHILITTILYGHPTLIIGLPYSISGFVRLFRIDVHELTMLKLMLRDRDWIYSKKHEGWYSVSDETFYPQSAVQLALDPATGRKFMVWSCPAIS